MLLMKADTARVTNQGINKFGTLYTDYELCHYVGKHVGIKWDTVSYTHLDVYKRQALPRATSEETEGVFRSFSISLILPVERPVCSCSCFIVRPSS